MSKARAYSRYLFRERHKKQYVLTKTKLVVGFLLSLLGSVFVGSYFERYGPVIVHQAITAIRTIVSDSPEAANDTQASTPADSESGAEAVPTAEPTEDISELENRVKGIQFNSEANRKARSGSNQAGSAPLGPDANAPGPAAEGR